MKIKDLKEGQKYGVIWRDQLVWAIFVRPCRKFLLPAGLFHFSIHVKDWDHNEEYYKWELHKVYTKNVIREIGKDEICK